MFPEPITIPWIGATIGIRFAFLLLAIGVGVVASIVWARRLEGVGPCRVALAQLAITGGALFGGRLHFELNRLDKHDSLWSVLASASHLTWSHHAAGAVLGLAVGVAIAAYGIRVPLGKLADAIVPSAGIGYAIMRVGCVAHGCCTGVVSFCAWCIAWPRESITFHEQVAHGLISEHAPHSALVHPLQFYFIAMGLAVTVLSLRFYRRKAYDGEIALGALAWFAGWSALLELYRADYTGRPYVLGMPQLMWIALAMFTVAVTVLIAKRVAVGRVVAPLLGEAH